MESIQQDLFSFLMENKPKPIAANLQQVNAHLKQGVCPPRPLSSWFSRVSLSPFESDDPDVELCTIKWAPKVLYGHKLLEYEVGSLSIETSTFSLIEYEGSWFLCAEYENGNYFLLPRVSIESIKETFNLDDGVHETPGLIHTCITNGFLRYPFEEVCGPDEKGGLVESKWGGQLYLTANMQRLADLSPSGGIDVYQPELLIEKDGSIVLWCGYESLSTGFILAAIDPTSVPKKYLSELSEEPMVIDLVPEPEVLGLDPEPEVMELTPVQKELLMLRIEGNRLELPSEKLNHYAEIKRLIQKAGGKYSKNGFTMHGKTCEEVIEGLLQGKRVKSRAQEMAFFSTGADWANIAVESAVLEGDLDESSRILEPHAGDGALADAIRERGLTVLTNEIWTENRTKLEKKGYVPTAYDFLKMDVSHVGGEKLDAIICNPPWGKLVEIDHVLHAISLVKEGGVVSALVSPSVESNNTKKAKAFRELDVYQNAQKQQVPAGSFNNTQVGGLHLLIRV